MAPGFAEQNGLEDAVELAGDEKVIEAVQARSTRPTSSSRAWSRSRSSRCCPTEWEPGGEELTPTMKLKRKPIAEKYEDEIEALYA